MAFLRYKITIEDDGIPVCEIRFNGADLANVIGEQLTRLIAIINPEMPEQPFWKQPYMQGHDD